MDGCGPGAVRDGRVWFRNCEGWMGVDPMEV